MPIATLRNRVAMTVTGTPGTGTITLNAAVPSFQSFTDAYGANATVDILIEDGTAWELAADCTYDDTAGTITRGTLIESSTGAALNLTSSAVVYAGLSADALRTFVQDAIAEASSKAAPVDGDEFGITDSAASGALKRTTWANLKATSKTYTDTLYSALGHNHAGVYDPAGTAAFAVTAHDTTSAHAGIVAAQTTAATSKATPVDADEIPLADSAASFALKKLTWANLKTVLGSTFAAIGNWVEEATNVVARRNGANAQSLRLYNTYTDASNYERLTITGTAGSNVELKAESAGTGAANLDVWISTKGDGRFFAGLNAGRVSTGAGTLAIGQNAAYRNTTGIRWTAIGKNAGYSNTTGNYWTAVGYTAGYSNTAGSNWTAVGYSAGFSNSSGDQWTAIGQDAGSSNTSGSFWTAISYYAGKSNTTGGYWTAIGGHAGYSNTTGSSWVAIGANAGLNNASNSNWVALGTNAARYLADGSSSATSFSSSTYIGTDTKVSANGVSNETAIGYNAIGSGSNTATIGNSSVIRNFFSGAIGSTELSADPADPAEGKWTMWMSDGTGAGDDGDIMIKITAGGVTKTATLVDFSTL